MKKDAAWALARPTPAQLNWQDMELGMFVHWFPFPNPDTIQKERLLDPDFRKELLTSCDISEFDAEEWVDAACDLGAKYIVFVAKHGLGFCRWRTEYSDFGLQNTNYPGDMVQELYDSCQKRGIRLGVYISGSSASHGAANQGITTDPAKQEAYNKVYRGWLTELLSRYGDMVEVWFDGSLAIEVGDILQKYAPNAMVFQSYNATIRWVGQEEGYASDPAWNSVSRYDALSGVSTQKHGNPDGECWMPLECDARLRREWTYNPDPKNKLHTLDELLNMYYQSVGHGAVLLINHAPNPKGKIEPADRARMKELGDEIRRRFSHPLAQTAGEGLIHEISFEKPQQVDHVVLMEDIRYGERIRGYRLEGLTDGVWSLLCTGSAVGHKKIDFFQTRQVTKLRLTIAGYVGTPILRSMEAYYVGSTPDIPPMPDNETFRVADFGIESLESYDEVKNRTTTLRYQIAQYIAAAGEYELWFDYDTEKKLIFDSASLVIEGASHPDYLTVMEDGQHFRLYLGGVSPEIAFTASLSMPNYYDISGRVYIKRVW